MHVVKTVDVTPRIVVQTRQWRYGKQVESTNDVLVDGKFYVRGVSDVWLNRIDIPHIGSNIEVIKSNVEKHPNTKYVGNGQFV
jgi:hypothetical protein